MGSVSKPDVLMAPVEVANASKTRGLEPVAIDDAHDRIATANWRGVVPTSLCRGIEDNHHESDDAGNWKLTVTVPAYTKAVGIRALGLVMKDPNNDAANAVLKYNTSATGFSKQLAFNQEMHGASGSVFSHEHAWSRPWVSSIDTADPSSTDWVSAPLAVPVSNGPQEVEIYLEAHSDLPFFIVAVQPYVIPYQATAWPELP